MRGQKGDAEDWEEELDEAAGEAAPPASSRLPAAEGDAHPATSHVPEVTQDFPDVTRVKSPDPLPAVGGIPVLSPLASADAPDPGSVAPPIELPAPSPGAPSPAASDAVLTAADEAGAPASGAGARREIAGATTPLSRIAPGPTTVAPEQAVADRTLEEAPVPEASEPAAVEDIEPEWPAALSRGLIALMAFLAPLCVQPAMFDLFDGSKRILCHELLALTFVTWSLGVAVSRKATVVLGPWHVAFGVFLLSQLPGVSLSVNRVAAVEEWLHRFLWLVAFFLASQLYRDHRSVVSLFAATVAGASGAAFLGLMQAGGVDFPSLYPQVAVPASSFGNKNMASEYIALVIPVTLWASLVSRRLWVVALSAAAGGFLGAYVLYSVTRASWVSLFAGVAVMLGTHLVMLVTRWLEKPEPDGPRRAALRHALIGTGLAAGLFTGILVVQAAGGVLALLREPAGAREGHSVTARDIVTIGTDLNTYSVTWRFRIWANAMALARDHLLCGVGLGNWKFWYPRYFDEVAVDTDFNARVQADTPHNDYLQFLGEAGLVGMLGLLALAASLVYLLWFTPSGLDPPDHGLVIGVTGMATIYAVDAVFSFPVQKAAPTFLLMTWLGALAGREPVQPSSRSRAIGLRHPFPALLPYAAVMLAVVISWRELEYFQSERGFKRGYLLMSEGKTFEAWQELKRAHAFRPDNHALSVFAGGIASELGLLEESVALNRRALESHPNFTNAYNQLGNGHWRLKRYDEAEAAYRKSLEIHPFLLEPLRNLASLMLAKGRMPEALDLLETMHKNHAASMTSGDRLDLAEAYRLTGNLDQSRKIYTDLQQEMPRDVRVPYALGEIARLTGRLDEAERQFRHALALAPGDTRAGLGLSKVLEARGRGEEARQLLERAVSVQPGNVAAQAELAESIHKSGDTTGAIEIYDELLRRQPGNASLHSRVASLHIARRDLRRAAEHLGRAIQEDPRRMQDWARLGKLQVDNGFLDQAILTFERALQHDPDESRILNELALVHNRLNQPQKALEYLARAAAQPGVEPEVFFNLGNTYHRLGQPPEAVKAFKTFLALWRGGPGPREQAERIVAMLSGENMTLPGGRRP